MNVKRKPPFYNTLVDVPFTFVFHTDVISKLLSNKSFIVEHIDTRLRWSRSSMLASKVSRIVIPVGVSKFTEVGYYIFTFSVATSSSIVFFSIFTCISISILRRCMSFSPQCFSSVFYWFAATCYTLPVYKITLYVLTINIYEWCHMLVL